MMVHWKISELTSFTKHTKLQLLIEQFPLRSEGWLNSYWTTKDRTEEREQEEKQKHITKENPTTYTANGMERDSTKRLGTVCPRAQKKCHGLKEQLTYKRNNTGILPNGAEAMGKL